MLSENLRIVAWLLTTMDWWAFDNECLLEAAQLAAAEDDVACFRMLSPVWWELVDLEAGPQCARIARAVGISLEIASEDALKAELDSQVAAGVVLEHHSPLPRELVLEVFRLADFYWVLDV